MWIVPAKITFLPAQTEQLKKACHTQAPS